MTHGLDTMELVELVEYERGLLNSCEIMRPLRPAEIWAGSIAVRRTTQLTATSGTFPAEVRNVRKSRDIAVDFDETTFDELAAHYIEGGEQEYGMLRSAYVGAGLARLLFLARGTNARTSQLRKFTSQMADSDVLLGRLYESVTVRPGEGIVRKLINHADAAAHINALRLCLGTWKEAHAGDEYAELLEPTFKNSLETRLSSKPDYVHFAGMFNVGQEGAEDTFAEFIAELQIAGACPMDNEELKQTVRILSP